MMETDENGVERQFYPITHASAVRGLEKLLRVNQKYYLLMDTGAVIITKRFRLRKCTDRTSLCDRRNRRYHC